MTGIPVSNPFCSKWDERRSSDIFILADGWNCGLLHYVGNESMNVNVLAECAECLTSPYVAAVKLSELQERTRTASDRYHSTAQESIPVPT